MSSSQPHKLLHSLRERTNKHGSNSDHESRLNTSELISTRRRSTSSLRLRAVLQNEQRENTSIAAHQWHRPSRLDSRSPCPALNVAANHGYLPREGRALSMWTIIKALQECYNLSWVLAIIITFSSFIILRISGMGKGWLPHNWTIDLEDLAVHGVLEHNGSLTHSDAGEVDSEPSSPDSRSVSLLPSTLVSTHESNTSSRLSLSSMFSLFFDRPTYLRVPCHPSPGLIRALLGDSASGTHLTLSDVARARVRRTTSSRPRPFHLEQSAAFEFALTLGIFSSDARNPKVELKVLHEWLEDERLPHGWKPTHVQGFLQTAVGTVRLQRMTAGLRKYKTKTRDVGAVTSWSGRARKKEAERVRKVTVTREPRPAERDAKERKKWDPLSLQQADDTITTQMYKDTLRSQQQSKWKRREESSQPAFVVEPYIGASDANSLVNTPSTQTEPPPDQQMTLPSSSTSTSPTSTSLNIQFSSDCSGTDVPPELDIPPYPSFVDIQFIPDWKRAGFPQELDSPPHPSSVDITFIQDSIRTGILAEPDVAPTESLDLQFLPLQYPETQSD